MKNKANHKVVTGFFLRVVSAVMGCFLGCLRVKDSSSNPTASSSLPAPSEVVMRKRNRLSNLMLTESRKEEDLEHGSFEVVANRQAVVDMKELKEEAKFLKAWGTLPETPNEIRKMSKEGKGQSSDNSDPEDLKSNPWLVGMPTMQLDIGKEPCQLPTPAQKCEESVKETVSLSIQNSGTTSNRSDEVASIQNSGTTSNRSDEVASIQNSGTTSNRSDEGSNGEQSAMPSKIHADQSYKSASNVPGKKSVSFYCDNGMSSTQNLSPEIDSEASKDLGAASNGKNLRPDPYPTPLRLSEEMQTPGTVFSAYQDGQANEKRTRIRSQYVKSVLNPVENLYQWQGMKPEVTELRKLSVDLKESLEEAEAVQSLSGKKMNMESDGDSRRKSNVTNQDEGNYSTLQEDGLRVRTLEDRPILGLVAAHWNEDAAASPVSPVTWDGNGIPNSTSKYKEDQKVRWHATPFVERLEKALSETTQRKQVISSGRSPAHL